MVDAANKLSGLYASLTSQIETSVRNIKEKGTESFAASTSAPAEKETGQVSFGYSYGYLEPNVAYNIHKISSEMEKEEKLKDKQAFNEQVNEEKEKNQQTQETAESLGISFYEELSFASKLDSRAAAQIYQKNDLSGYSEIPILFGGQNYTQYEPQYVAGVYDFVYNINQEQSGDIEYMYKYNKSYDYRV